MRLDCVSATGSTKKCLKLGTTSQLLIVDKIFDEDSENEL